MSDDYNIPVMLDGEEVGKGKDLGNGMMNIKLNDFDVSERIRNGFLHGLSINLNGM